MIAKYRAVLSAPGCARLLGTALVARLPQGMSSFAILLLVRGATHSYAAAGAALGAFAFASAAVAPLQGRLVDRFGRARVLVPLATLQGLVLVGLVVAARRWPEASALVALSALAGVLMPPIAPTVRALLREVLPDAAVRETAYALESTVQELIWIAGPLLVAAVIAVTSPAVALIVCAIVCEVGTLLFVASPAVHDARSREPRTRRGSALRQVRELRLLIGPIALTGVGLGATEVGIPSLALHAGSRAAAGLLLALWSLGSMTGGLWYGSRVWTAPLEARYRALLLAAVAFNVPFLFARSIPAGIVASLLAGVTIAPVFSCQYALIGRGVTAGVETEAFTWATAALVGGIAAGSAIAGATIGAAGVVGPFVLAITALAIAAALAVRMRVRIGRPVPAMAAAGASAQATLRPGAPPGTGSQRTGGAGAGRS